MSNVECRMSTVLFLTESTSFTETGEMKTRSQTELEKKLLLSPNATLALGPLHLLNSPVGATPRPPGSTPGHANSYKIAEKTLKLIEDLEKDLDVVVLKIVKK